MIKINILILVNDQTTILLSKLISPNKLTILILIIIMIIIIIIIIIITITRSKIQRLP